MGLCAQRVEPECPVPPEGILDALIARVASGDEIALGALYDATSRQVFGLGLRILGDRALAEEAVVDVFTQIWQKAARFDPSRGSALTWLLMMARSRAIDLRRSRTAPAEREVCIETLGHFADPSSGPEEQSEESQRAERVRRALGRLPQDQRDVIEAAFMLGLTHSEIAAALGKPLGTIKTRIRLGLAALRSALVKEDGTLS